MRKFVVSASRRTDLLACQPDRLVSILNGHAHFAQQLRPDRIHTLLISTKDFRPLLDNPAVRETCAQCDQICVNLTITGLGGTHLEPRVPRPDALLDRLPELSGYLGSPLRITWCFDPVLEWEGLGNMSKQLFTELADRFASVGIRRVMAMFFRNYGNSRISPRETSDAEKSAFAQRADSICRDLGLDLSFCHVPSFHRMKCVDLEWMASLHPEQDASPVAHYRKVRSKHPTSHCRDAIWDIGWYNPPCAHGCVYCYARAQQDGNADHARDSVIQDSTILIPSVAS